MDELAKVDPRSVKWTMLTNRMILTGDFEIDGQRYTCEVTEFDVIARGDVEAKREAIMNAKPVWEKPFTFTHTVTAIPQVDNSTWTLYAGNIAV
jgi:Fe-S-cluster formation regulator IscX/YfhJ